MSVPKMWSDFEFAARFLPQSAACKQRRGPVVPPSALGFVAAPRSNDSVALLAPYPNWCYPPGIMTFYLLVFTLAPSQPSPNKYSLAITNPEAADLGIIKTRRGFPTLEAVTEFVEKTCSPMERQMWDLELPGKGKFRWVEISPESAKEIEEQNKRGSLN